jgi:signal transduction histidine kinase
LEKKTHELFSANQELEHRNNLLQRQQKSLILTEKLAALGQLAAGTAHEINNPLAFVISNIRTLKKYFDTYQKMNNICRAMEPKPSDLQQLLDLKDMDYLINDSQLIFNEIQEGLERVRDITTNMKRFSRSQPGDREHCSVNDVIETALKISRNTTKYHCTITTDFSPTPEIYCNSNELVQVFLNLIINAAQSIKSEGEIKIQACTEGKLIVVEVNDTGSGIEESHLGKIFDPFFTAKPLGEGTGLGLSVSYGLIKELDGNISVTSKLGQGSTFRVAIPIDQRKNNRTRT